MFVQYLKDNNPQAKVAILYQNDDFGKAYLDPLKAAAIEGTDIELVAEETYEPTDPNVDSQMTTLAASDADTIFLGTTGLKCPQGLDAGAASGKFETVYLSGTCTAAILMSLAKPESTEGVISTVYIKDPTDPQYADDEAMQLYMEKVPQYNPAADVNDGLVAYGWTQGGDPRRDPEGGRLARPGRRHERRGLTRPRGTAGPVPAGHPVAHRRRRRRLPDRDLLPRQVRQRIEAVRAPG